MKLERLLKEFPDEPVQGHRWEKIARALGNRTPRQVSSRVLKLFARMARAGVPVPGKFNTEVRFAILCALLRRCHLSTRFRTFKSGRKSAEASSRTQRQFRSSCVFASSVSFAVQVLTTQNNSTSHIQYYRAPVVALPDDSEDEAENEAGSGAVTGTDSDKMDIDDEDDELKQFAHLKDTDEFRELMRLKKLQRRKQSRAREVYVSPEDTGDAVHFGFQCDSCGVEPIVGIRFHCLQCSAEISVDLCSKCHQEGSFTTDTHPRTHRFQRFEEPMDNSFFADRSYTNPALQYRTKSTSASSSRAAESDTAYLSETFLPL